MGILYDIYDLIILDTGYGAKKGHHQGVCSTLTTGTVGGLVMECKKHTWEQCT